MGSAAQPILDLRDKVSKWASKWDSFIGPGGVTPSKPDKAWDDERVRKATESFVKRAQANAAAKKRVSASGQPKLNTAKKNAPAKKPVRKISGRKY